MPEGRLENLSSFSVSVSGELWQLRNAPRRVKENFLGLLVYFQAIRVVIVVWKETLCSLISSKSSGGGGLFS